MRQPSDDGRSNGNFGWIHQLTPEQARSLARGQRTAIATSGGSDRATAQLSERDHATRHLLYTKLLALADLSTADRAHLLARGVSDELLERAGYATLPPRTGGARGRLAKALEAFTTSPEGRLAGLDVTDVWRLPGCKAVAIARGAGAYTTLAGPDGGGVLIPVRDPDGRIQGLQIRRYDRDVEAHATRMLAEWQQARARAAAAGEEPPKHPGRPARYLWFSAKGDADDTGYAASPGAPLHLARPAQRRSDTLFITEGPLKGDIAAELLGADVLAMPGVGMGRHAVDLVKRLDPTRQRAIAVALDSEPNPHTIHARVELTEALHKAGYQVWVATWLPEWKGLDDLLLAGRMPALSPRQQPKPKRRELRVITNLANLRPDEPPEVHQARLQEIADLRRAAYVAWYDNPDNVGKIALDTGGPGEGKTQTMMDVLGERDGAYIAPRREEVDTETGEIRMLVRTAISFDIQEPRTPDNCIQFEKADALQRRGRDVIHSLCERCPLNQPNNRVCIYLDQMRATDPRMFQYGHLTTITPPTYNHPAMGVDENPIAALMPQRLIPISALKAAVGAAHEESPRARLLRALQVVVAEEAQRRRDELAKPQPVYRPLGGPRGRAFYDRLNAVLGGELELVLKYLRNIIDSERVVNADRFSAEELENLPPVVLPDIVDALDTDFFRWLRGEEFNSGLAAAKINDGQEACLVLTHRQPIQTKKGVFPPTIYSDASANIDMARALFGREVVKLDLPALPLPSTVEHWTVRDGGGYTKWGLAKSKAGLARVITRARLLLQMADPDGKLRAAERVGLVTFQFIEKPLAEALGIPYGKRSTHYFGARGRNELEDVEVLLVIGTPTANPEDLDLLAAALAQGEQPLDTTVAPGDGGYVYADPRLAMLYETFRAEELRQAAARCRPVRAAGKRKVIISLCGCDIPGLPATKTIVEWPVQRRLQRRLAEMERAAGLTQQCADDQVAMGLGGLDGIALRDINAKPIDPPRPINAALIQGSTHLGQPGAGLGADATQPSEVVGDERAPQSSPPSLPSTSRARRRPSECDHLAADERASALAIARTHGWAPAPLQHLRSVAGAESWTAFVQNGPPQEVRRAIVLLRTQGGAS